MNEFFFVIYIFLSLASIIGFVLYKKGISKVQDYLEPYYLFVGSFWLYSTIGAYSRLNQHSDNMLMILVYYYLTIILGIIAFSLGYCSRIKDTSKVFENIKTEKRNTFWAYRQIRYTEIVLLTFFLLFNYFNIDTVVSMFKNFGTGIGYLEYSIRTPRTGFSGPLSLLNSYFYLFFLAFPFSRFYEKRKMDALDICLYLTISVFLLASGKRVVLIYVVFSLLIYFNYRIKRIGIYKISVFLFVFLLLFVSLTHLRADNNLVDMIKNFNSSFFQVKNNGEFVATTGTYFTHLQAYFSGTVNRSFGKEYLVEFLLFIPKFIFPNRPLPLPEQYMLDFFPSALAGTGHGWFILNDGFMSFGALGVFLEMFLYGRLLVWSYYKFINRLDNPIIAFSYTIFSTYVLISTRSSILGTIKNYLLTVMPFLLIYLVFYFKKLRLKKR